MYSAVRTRSQVSLLRLFVRIFCSSHNLSLLRFRSNKRDIHGSVARAEAETTTIPTFLIFKIREKSEGFCSAKGAYEHLKNDEIKRTRRIYRTGRVILLIL